jgi:tRNA threonylcarbamoyladenosine biosynthesis protein TsaE
LGATSGFGREFGSKLQPGDVVALIGPLGAGKTHLVRAIAEGLGIPDSRVVSSPTFTLIHEYKGRLPIFHFDVYRLKSPAEFLDLGVAEYFDAGGVCLIEWADRVLEYLPANRIAITLEITGETSRSVTLDEASEPRTK